MLIHSIIAEIMVAKANKPGRKVKQRERMVFQMKPRVNI